MEMKNPEANHGQGKGNYCRAPSGMRHLRGRLLAPVVHLFLASLTWFSDAAEGGTGGRAHTRPRNYYGESQGRGQAIGRGATYGATKGKDRSGKHPWSAVVGDGIQQRVGKGEMPSGDWWALWLKQLELGHYINELRR